MNWLASLFTSGDAVKTVGDTLQALFTNNDAREKALEMQKAQQAYDLELAKLESQALQNQTDVNKIEASSTSLFVSGWRPAIGWVCGAALSYAAIIEPVGRFIAVTFFDYKGEFPHIDTTITMQILIGMLGLGGMRSFEKYKGVASK